MFKRCLHQNEEPRIHFKILLISDSSSDNMCDLQFNVNCSEMYYCLDSSHTAFVPLNTAASTL